MSAECVPCQTDAAGRRIRNAPPTASCRGNDTTVMSRCIWPILVAAVVLCGSAFAEGLADAVPEAGFGETIDAWWDRPGELAR